MQNVFPLEKKGDGHYVEDCPITLFFCDSSQVQRKRERKERGTGQDDLIANG